MTIDWPQLINWIGQGTVHGLVGFGSGALLAWLAGRQSRAQDAIKWQRHVELEMQKLTAQHKHEKELLERQLYEEQVRRNFDDMRRQINQR